MKVNAIALTENNVNIMFGTIIDDYTYRADGKLDKWKTRNEIINQLSNSLIVLSIDVCKNIKQARILIIEYQGEKFYISKEHVQQIQMTKLEFIFNPRIKTIRNIKSIEDEKGFVIQCELTNKDLLEKEETLYIEG